MIKLKDKEIKTIYKGNTPITKIYKGSNLVWSKNTTSKYAYQRFEDLGDSDEHKIWSFDGVNKFSTKHLDGWYDAVIKIYFKNFGGQYINYRIRCKKEQIFDVGVFNLDSDTESTNILNMDQIFDGDYRYVDVSVRVVDNDEHFIKIQYNPTYWGYQLDVIIMTYELFGNVDYAVVPNEYITSYYYQGSGEVLKNDYIKLLPYLNGKEMSDYVTGDLYQQEIIKGSIISVGDTIYLNDTAYNSVVPSNEINDDSVYSVKFTNPTNIIFYKPLKINSFNVGDIKRFVKNIRGAENLDTSNMTSFNNLLNGCFTLTSIDVSKWDTSNVTDMTGVFMDCSTLTSIDVSKWDTSNCEDMRHMFFGCSNLNSVDVSNFKTSKVHHMQQMFLNDVCLTQLDVSNWDVSNVINLSEIVGGCNQLTSIDVSNWDTSSCEDMSGMFKITPIETVDISKLNGAKLKNMSYIFQFCNKLQTVKLPNVGDNKKSNITDINSMFYYCPNLSLIDFGDFDWDNVGSNLGGDWSFLSDGVELTVKGNLSNIHVDLPLNQRNLTHDSVMVFINGLKEITDGSTKTLTLNETTYNLMSEDEIKIATDKGWTVSKG